MIFRPTVLKLVILLAVSIGTAGATESEELFTYEYIVPPSFLDVGNLRGDQDNPNWITPVVSSQKLLERAGITFGPGASAVYQAGPSRLIVRNTLSQIDLVEAFIDGGVNVERQSTLIVVLEAIKADAKSIDSWKADDGVLPKGIQLRSEVQTEIRLGRANLVETAVLNCRSGQRHKVESIRESTVPVASSGKEEEVDADLGERNGETLRPLSGMTLEVDSAMAADGATVDLGVKFWYQPSGAGKGSGIKEGAPFPPVAINTQATVTDDNYQLLSMQYLPESENADRQVLLIFVRVDVAKMDGRRL